MAKIDTEKWIPDPESSDKLVYAGQRSAHEVYQEIKQYLSAIGYLPDEYFLIGDDWREGELFPKNGYVTQKVDFGGSEGIYLDAYINYKDDSGERQSKNFFTGKTLGETAEDLNRMHLAAAAISVGLQGEGHHARWMVFKGSINPNGLTIQMNQDELSSTANALLIARSNQKAQGQDYEQTEKTLRRLVGSITGYMQMVGEKPLSMDSFDLAELAIRESDLNTFNKVLPDIKNHQDGELLLQAASQPGRIGSIMTNMTLAVAENIPYGTYLNACKKAVTTGELERVQHMLEKAPDCIIAEEYNPKLFGEVVKYAYTNYTEDFCGAPLAKDLLRKSPPEQVQHTPAVMAVLAIQHGDEDMALHIIESGVDVSQKAGELLYAAADKYRGWFLQNLIKNGVDINANNHHAMRTCMRFNNMDAAKMLLDYGADFAAFTHSIAETNKGFSEIAFITTMEQYSVSLRQAADSQEQELITEPQM